MDQITSKRYLSLRIKIWLAFVLLFTPVFVVSYYWFYEYTSARLLNSISTELINTLNGAIKGMDVANFVQLYEEESAKNPNCPPPKDAPSEQNGYYPEDNPRYLAHVNWLRSVQQFQPNTRLYTYIKGTEPGEIIAIGSTGYFRTPRGGFRFCQRYKSTSTRIYDGLFGRVDAWKPYKDNFGEWITTYMPIVDADGKIVGAIGADIEAGYLRQVQRGILVSGSLAFLLSYALIFYSVYLLSGALTHRILLLNRLVEQVGEGQYAIDFAPLEKEGTFRDEIDNLSSIFKVMVGKVYEREQKLRERVQELEIVIDETKRQSEVQAIVESDFFQELQNKAQRLRKRYTEG
ncbi:MAG: PDC sensor domain-containing protein [Anaerolineales bacterium]